MTTIKELHIAIDMAINHISSNRKGSLPVELVDMVINSAVRQSINSKLSPYLNPTHEGFEDVIRNYMSFEKLKTIVNKVVEYGTSDCYINLPLNCLYPVTGTCLAKFDKSLSTTPLKDSNLTKVYSLQFANSVATTDSKYKDLKLTLNGKDYTIPDTIPIIKDAIGKFTLINYLIDTLRMDGYDVTFDNGSKYSDSSFIFVSDTQLTGTLSYDSVSVNLVDKTPVVKVLDSVPTLRVPLSIIKGSNLTKQSLNLYYTKYPNRELRGEIISNRIRFIPNLAVPIASVELEYLRFPRLANYYTGVMPEIDITDEIVAIAANKLLAMSGDPTYKLQENELIKI